MGVRQQSWDRVATPAEFDEKASTSSSDPEGGLAHHWGQTVTVTCPCSLAVPHMQEAEYQDSGGNGCSS